MATPFKKAIDKALSTARGAFKSTKPPTVKDPEDLPLDASDPDVVNVPEGNERDWINYVLDTFNDSASSRYAMELDWTLALAFEEDRQWLARTFKMNEIRNLMNESEWSRYMTVNRMGTNLQKVEAIITQGSPDIQFLPDNASDPLDIEAAKVAQAIYSHYSYVHKRPMQTKDRVAWMLKSTTCFLKVWWDKTMERKLPLLSETKAEFDEQGNPVPAIESIELVQAGGVQEDVIPGFEVYLDPYAKTWSEVRYLIHATMKPLGWFVSQFGEKIGGKVTSDQGMSSPNGAGYVDGYLTNTAAAIGVGASPVNYTSTRRNRAQAAYYEYWELPNGKRPDGLYICCTDGVLLHYGPWPYKKRDTFPFVPAGYLPRAGTPYHRSLAEKVMSAQVAYNRQLSSLLEQSENEVDYAIAPEGSGSGPDWDEKIRGVRTRVPVSYDPASGREPTIVRAPGVSPGKMGLATKFEEIIDGLCGTHDVSKGLAPAGTPAEAVAMLTRNNDSQHSRAIESLQSSMPVIGEWVVALETEFSATPFILAYADKADTLSKDPDVALHSIEALRNGGNYHIRAVTSSSNKQTPEEETQQFMGLYQLGMFGPPGSPQAARLFFTVADVPQKDKILALLDQQQQEMQAQQAQQMQMQQAQMQGQPAPVSPQEQLQLDNARKQHDVGLEMQRSEHAEGLKRQTMALEKKMSIEADAARHALNPPQSPSKPSAKAR